MATVVSGLILSFLGWISGLLPAIWDAISYVALTLLHLITINVQTPVWALVLLALLCVFGPRIVSRYWITSGGGDAETRADSESDQQEIGHDDFYFDFDFDSLEEDEKRLLNFMVQIDGSSVQISQISRRLGFSKLQSQQIVEALCQYDLLTVRSNPVQGSQIYLTKNGRDLVMGNKYART